MRTMSEAELVGPQAWKINTNKYTPRLNWIGDKEYDPACLLTGIEFRRVAHNTHLTQRPLYWVFVCVSRQREKDQTSIPTLEQIQYTKGQTVQTAAA